MPIVKNGATWNQKIETKLEISRRFPKEQKVKERPGNFCYDYGKR